MHFDLNISYRSPVSATRLQRLCRRGCINQRSVRRERARFREEPREQPLPTRIPRVELSSPSTDGLRVRSASANVVGTSQIAAEDILGWHVFKGDLKVLVGVVEDVIEAGEASLSPPLVKVVNDSPAGVRARPGIRERHNIPFVSDIFVALDASRKQAIIKPPRGLLQLGRQQLILDIISPRVLEIAGQESNSGEILPSLLPMPTRAQLEKRGELRLLQGIVSAGGFTAVAQKLGLRLPRRPNGFWENLENIDEELSLLVAAHWAELQHPEEDQTYFYNPITGRSQWIKPEPPTKIPLDNEGTVLLAEDERDRVMPSQSNVKAAGRYDLHHAIVNHGGYRPVAEMLDRIPAWPKNRLAANLDLLLKELKAAQQQIFGGGPCMPSAKQLIAIGRSDLRQAILQSGGFHAVAALAGFEPQRRPRSHWASVETVVEEIERVLESGECPTEAGWFPMRRELIAIKRDDLVYAVGQHGSRCLAAKMGLRLRTAGRKKKAKDLQS